MVPLARAKGTCACHHFKLVADTVVCYTHGREINEKISLATLCCIRYVVIVELFHS